MSYTLNVKAKINTDDVIENLDDDDIIIEFINRLNNCSLYDFMDNQSKTDIISFYDDELITDEVSCRANEDYNILQTLLDGLNNNTKKELFNLLKDELVN